MTLLRRTWSVLIEDLYLPRHYCGSISSCIHYLVNNSYLHSSFYLENWKWGITWRFELPAGLTSNSEPLLIWSAREVEFFNTRVVHDKVALRFHISHFTRQGDWDLTFGSVQSKENRHLTNYIQFHEQLLHRGPLLKSMQMIHFFHRLGPGERCFTPWLGLLKE